MHRFWTMAAAALTLALSVSTTAQAGAIHGDVPEQPDPTAKYMIYLHGAWPETHPLSEPHSTRGLFEYDKILTALAGAGFEVISEHRKEKTNPRRYARERVVKQVEALVARGVPASNITLVGYSKGGQIALLAGTFIPQPDLNLVSLAGCEKAPVRLNYDRFLSNDAARLQGRMLSVFDKADKLAGTCREAAEKAPKLTFEEVVIEVGAGHGAFYTPNQIWIDLIAKWANPQPEKNG
jgi:hypothetical protein